MEATRPRRYTYNQDAAYQIYGKIHFITTVQGTLLLNCALSLYPHPTLPYKAHGKIE